MKSQLLVWLYITYEPITKFDDQIEKIYKNYLSTPKKPFYLFWLMCQGWWSDQYNEVFKREETKSNLLSLKKK